MATTTVYDVKVRYMLDDRASAGTRNIGTEAGRSGKRVGMLSNALNRLSVLAAGAFGFGMAKRALVDYNSQLDQARIQMRGLLSMNMGGTWTRNQVRANFLISKFKDDAKASTATTKDFVDFASLVTGPLSRAGASIAQIRDVTRGGVIAAKAFGIEGEFAARDIEQALAGTLGKKDRFARALLEPMGLTTKKWNEMVKRTPGQAASMLVKAFNQPAILNMAKDQEKSWAGVTSTLEDNLQRTFGKIGLPLMQAMSAEFTKLNAWFDKNPEKVNQIAKSVSEAMVGAFKLVKETFGFIIRHRRMLTLLAKAALLGKGVGMLARGLHGGAGALMGLSALSRGSDQAAQGLTTFGAKVGHVAGRLTAAAGALAVFGVAAQATADMFLARQEERQERTTQIGILRDALGRQGRGAFGEGGGGFLRAQRLRGAFGDFSRKEMRQFRGGLAVARESGIIGKGGDISRQAVASRFGLLDVGSGQVEIDRIVAELTLLRDIVARADWGRAVNRFGMFVQKDFEMRQRANQTTAQVLMSYARSTIRGVPELLGAGLDHLFAREKGVEGDKGKVRGDKTTNVKIGKIEIVSEDPDRFGMQLVGAFEDFNGNITQAVNAVRER